MLNRFLYSVALLCFCSLPGLSQHPVINEVMYSNRSGITDQDGDTSDWIEIYNPESEAINIEGWQITDDITKSKYWLLRLRLEPASCVLLQVGLRTDLLELADKLSLAEHSHRGCIDSHAEMFRRTSAALAQNAMGM